MPACTRWRRSPACRLTAAHDASAIQRGLNAALPRAVRVVAVEKTRRRASTRATTPPARSTSTASSTRRYCRRSWPAMPGTCPSRSTSRRCARAAARLVGRHDFAAFQGTGSAIQDTVRTVERLSGAAARGPTGPGDRRSPPTASSGTWCGTWSARWSTSGCGRWTADGVEAIWPVARPAPGGPDGAAAGAVPGPRPLLTAVGFIIQSGPARALLGRRNSLYHQGFVSA